MARNATFKILIAYETYKRFAILIRAQETSEQRGTQLILESDIVCGIGKSGRPDHPQNWGNWRPETTAFQTETDGCGEISNPV